MPFESEHIPPIAPVPEQRQLTAGRRVFLKAMLGTAAVVVFDGWKSIDDRHQTSPEAPVDTEPTSGPAGSLVAPAEEPVKAIDKRLEENPTFSDTVHDQLLATAGITGYTLLTDNRLARLGDGNTDLRKALAKYRQHRLRVATALVIEAPLVEETLFRALPAVGGKKGSLMPVRGIISTYLFGKIHQFKIERTPFTRSQEVVLDPNRIPVQQYALGGFLWMLARRRGVAHSMLAHALNNSIALGGIEVISHAKKNQNTPEPTPPQPNLPRTVRWQERLKDQEKRQRGF